MAKDKKKAEQTITIEGKEYKVSDLSPKSVQLVNHCLDLDNKINTMSFNLAQLQGGKEYFILQLKASLNESNQPTA